MLETQKNAPRRPSPRLSGVSRDSPLLHEQVVMQKHRRRPSQRPRHQKSVPGRRRRRKTHAGVRRTHDVAVVEVFFVVAGEGDFLGAGLAGLLHLRRPSKMDSVDVDRRYLMPTRAERKHRAALATRRTEICPSFQGPDAGSQGIFEHPDHRRHSMSK